MRMCGPDNPTEILLGGIAAGVMVGGAVAAKFLSNRAAAWRELAKVWRSRFNHACDERDAARREAQALRRNA